MKEQHENLYLFLFCLFNLTAYPTSTTENSSFPNNIEEFFHFMEEANSFIFSKEKKMDTEFRNIILDIAPDGVKGLAFQMKECTKNPTQKCPSHILFTGGNDLTRKKFARAIAENAEIPHITIGLPFLLNNNKSFTPEMITFVETITKTKHKVIIIIDWLDCIREGHTANAVTMMLNRFSHNSNITVIGIMDSPWLLHGYLNEIFSPNMFLFKTTHATIKQKKELLHYHLKKFNNTCDEKCEDSISKSLKTVEPESIEAIVERTNMKAYLGKEINGILRKKI